MQQTHTIRTKIAKLRRDQQAPDPELLHLDEMGRGYEFDLTRCSFVHQYLISKGYDVPLFFTPDHWANCKTAIELNIAIENNL